MKKNIGTGDRVYRLVLGLGLIGLAIWQKSIVLAAVGLFTLYEALAGWCVVNQLLGKNSCDIGQKK